MGEDTLFVYSSQYEVSSSRPNLWKFVQGF